MIEVLESFLDTAVLLCSQLNNKHLKFLLDIFIPSEHFTSTIIILRKRCLNVNNPYLLKQRGFEISTQQTWVSSSVCKT